VKRLFWVGVGVAVGVTATRKVNEVTKKATPSGIGTSLGEGLRELGAGLGAFGAEVRAGMNERSDELYAMVEETTAIPVRPESPPSSARHARAPRRGASHAR
jgi:hypothetical protein